MISDGIIGNEVVGPLQTPSGVEMTVPISINILKTHVASWFKKKLNAYVNSPSHSKMKTNEYPNKIYFS